MEYERAFGPPVELRNGERVYIGPPLHTPTPQGEAFQDEIEASWKVSSDPEPHIEPRGAFDIKDSHNGMAVARTGHQQATEVSVGMSPPTEPREERFRESVEHAPVYEDFVGGKTYVHGRDFKGMATNVADHPFHPKNFPLSQPPETLETPADEGVVGVTTEDRIANALERIATALDRIHVSIANDLSHRER